MEAVTWDAIIVTLKARIVEAAATDVKAAAEAAEVVLRIEQALGIAATAAAKPAVNTSPFGGQYDPFAEEK